MTDFILGAIAGLCAWHLFFAGRWLRRRLHPWNAEVDARARAYLVKPCKLWEETPPPLAPGKRLITASGTMVPSSDALEAEPTIAPILPFSRSAPLTTPTIPAGQHSPFAVRQDVSPPSDGTPAQGA